MTQKPTYTSVEGMKRSDGSIGTVKIPSLGINMKVWEGETNSNMKKGLGITAPPRPGTATWVSADTIAVPNM